MARIFRRVALAVVSLLVSGVLLESPAGADGAGGLEFGGDAHLPTFPCSLSANCRGTFNGHVNGTLGGQQVNTWQANLVNATLASTFEYADSQCTEGTAEGTATVTAGLGQVIGFWKLTENATNAPTIAPPDNIIPNPTTGAPVPILGLRAEIRFDWARDGATATLRMLDVDVFLTLPVGGTTGGQTEIQVMLNGTGRAVAGFVAHFSTTPDCVSGTGPGVPVTAEVLGSGAIADPA